MLHYKVYSDSRHIYKYHDISERVKRTTVVEVGIIRILSM